MGAGEHPVRQGEGDAGATQPDGDVISSGLEDEAGHRFPEIESNCAIDVVPERVGFGDDQESLRGPTRGLLPIRPQPEIGRHQKDASQAHERDRQGPTVGCSSGRHGEEENSIKASHGPAEPSNKGETREAGEVDVSRRLSESKESSKECFLDNTRLCNSGCAAFQSGQKDPCRILGFLDRVLVLLRPQRPAAPPPPKVL